MITSYKTNRKVKAGAFILEGGRGGPGGFPPGERRLDVCVKSY